MSTQPNNDLFVLSLVRKRAAEVSSGFPYATWQFLLFEGVMFLLACMAYWGAIMAEAGSPAGIVCYTIALSSCLLQAAALGHQGFHQALFRSQRGNSLIAYITFLLAGVDGTLWRLRHLLDHHPHTNVQGHDNDLDSPTFLRLAPYTEWRSYHRYQPYYAPLVYSAGTLITIFYSDWFCLSNAIKRGIGIKSNRALIAGFIIRKLAFILIWFIFPVILSQTLTVGWVIIYFLLASVPVAWLLFPIGMAHMNDYASFYEPAEEVGFVELQIATTVDFCPNNQLITLLYGGLNSHLAHHLYPKVASCHHRALYAEMSKQAPQMLHRKIDLDLLQLYRSHFRCLKALSLPPPEVQPQAC